MTAPTVRRGTALNRAANIVVLGLLLVLACDRDLLVAPRQVPVAPTLPNDPAFDVTLEPGQNDSPAGQSGSLAWVDQEYGTQSAQLDLNVAHPTVYKLEAMGSVTKRLAHETIEPVPPVTYGPNGKLAISWMYGSGNNTVTYGTPATYILLLPPSRVYWIAQSGLGNESIYGTLTKPDGSPLYCGSNYGSYCYVYEGEPSTYSLTRQDAELMISADSGTVTTGSIVKFRIGAAPDSIGQFLTPLSVDTVAWIPDPDSSGGDYSEAKTWGACAFSNRQCTRQIVGAGTLKVVAHVNGRRFVGLAHVGTRDKLRLKAVKAYISRGDSVTFTPSMSDSSAFTPYGWSWKADSVTPGQTTACGWQTSPCRTRVWEDGWMTITVFKNGVQRKARAHVTIGPRPRLQVDALAPVVQPGTAATFRATAGSADLSVQRWEFNGVVIDDCGALVSCSVVPIDSGVMWAYGVVEGEQDADSASVRVEEGCAQPSMLKSGSVDGFNPNSLAQLNCTEDPAPALRVQCSSVVRGSFGQCTATAVNGTISTSVPIRWSFNAPGVSILATTSTPTWDGTIALTGTVRATATVNGVEVSDSDELSVTPRDWSNVETPSFPFSVDSQTNLNSRIRVIRGDGVDHVPDLGEAFPKAQMSFSSGTADFIGSGPNKGLAYLRVIPVVRDIRVRVNYGALANGSHFWSLQDSLPAPVGANPYAYCSRLDVEPFRGLVEQHEGVPPPPWNSVPSDGYPSHSHTSEYAVSLTNTSRVKFEPFVGQAKTNSEVSELLLPMFGSIERLALALSAGVDRLWPITYCKWRYDP